MTRMPLTRWWMPACLAMMAVGCSDCGEPPAPVLAEIQFVGDRTSLESTFNANFKLEIRLDASNDQEVSVDFETVEGTALMGEDFEYQAGTVTFAPGELVKDIFVGVVIDDALESDEVFYVDLSNPTNGYLGAKTRAVCTILNDDTQLVIDIPEGGYDTPHDPNNPPAGMSLVWSDEFDGSGINSANWIHELGASGWGNQELQNYTNSSANSYTEDGNLVIVALEEGGGYTSARMKSQGLQEFQFGRIDVRAVLPQGQGLWPAIWMLGANHSEVGWPECGEIDIMELKGDAPNKVYGTCHWGEIVSGGGHPNVGSTVFSDFPATYADEFHVFSLEWSPDTMVWLMNDEPYHMVTTQGTIDPAGYPTPFNDPFFFILNVAVGGTFLGYPDETTLFPQFMAIDYVRVYQ